LRFLKDGWLKGIKEATFRRGLLVLVEFYNRVKYGRHAQSDIQRAVSLLEKFVSSFLANRVLKSVKFSHNITIGLIRATDLSLNIRVPFCRFQCPFCLFVNYPYDGALSDLYVRAVKRELRAYSTHLEENSVKSINNVYFSGGTPSLISDKLKYILDCIHELFGLEGNVALESSPLDLNDETLRRMVNMGVNQISIGVQSFNSNILRGIGRKYDGEKALSAVRKAIDSGFDYVNIDLMFPLPGQTVDSLIQDLELAVKLNVHGISTYPLMLLPHTEMYKQLKDKVPGMEDMEKKMYMTILDYMSSVGYDVRSIWSFTTRPGFYNGPFEYDEYLGIGPYAWGIVGNLFTINTPSFENYLVMVKKKIPIIALAKFGDEELMLVRFSRKLYHCRVNKSDFNSKFNVNIDKKLGWLIYIMRLAGLVENGGDILRLTRKGMLYGSLTTKKIVIGLLTRMHKATGYYPP